MIDASFWAARKFRYPGITDDFSSCQMNMACFSIGSFQNDLLFTSYQSLHSVVVSGRVSQATFKFRSGIMAVMREDTSFGDKSVHRRAHKLRLT